MRRLAAVAAAAVLALASAAPAAARVSRPSLATASAAILIDARSGAPLLEKDADARRPIASTTKLMTAFLVLERADLNAIFKAPAYDAAPAESQIHLGTGERMRARDLLGALLLESANDAAVDLAVGVAGSREAFVEQMNQHARQLGLRDTHYANPIGLDDARNYSSARDLARLAARLMQNRIFAAIVDKPRAVLRSGAYTRVVHNRNLLIGRYRFVDGVKTGHTSHAGYILVGAAHGHGGKVISVVLGEPSESARDADSLALLRYGIDQFHKVTAVRPNMPLAYAKVAHHSGMRIALVARRRSTYTLRRGQRLRLQVDAPAELSGPIPAGRRVGWVRVVYLGRTVRRLGLVTAKPVPGASVIARATDALGPPLTAVALILVVLGGVLSGVKLRSMLSRRQRAMSS